MNCPNCDVELERVEYENNPVFHCPQCAGYLLKRIQVSMIKSMRERSTESLQQDAARGHGAGTQTQIRCPRCRAETMHKQKITLSQLGGDPFFVDACRKCQLVWFDGGELARLQLEYELSDQAVEELNQQLRVAERTPEEQEELDRRLAALPDRGFHLFDIFSRGVWGMTFVLLGLALLVWHVLTSPLDLSFLYDWKFLVGVVASGVGVRLILPG